MNKWIDAKAIGVYGMSNWGGLEVLDIVYGVDDYLVTCFNFGNGRTCIRKNKVEYTATGRAYIRKCNSRYYLNEIMRR